MYRIFAQIYFIYLRLKDASTNYVFNNANEWQNIVLHSKFQSDFNRILTKTQLPRYFVFKFGNLRQKMVFNCIFTAEVSSREIHQTMRS